MKPRTRKILAATLACMWLLIPLTHVERASGAPATDSTTPTPSGRGEGKKKKNRDGSTASPAPAGNKGGGTIPLPLPIGKPGVNVKIPDMDTAGKLLSLLMAQKATRLDDDRVQMEEMHMDFNKPDGKQDFHIVMPTSILNLKTHIITSDNPVEIRTQDFELTGEKMEFNTVEREGKLVGSVRMVIHNLKQLTAPKDAGEKPQ